MDTGHAALAPRSGAIHIKKGDRTPYSRMNATPEGSRRIHEGRKLSETTNWRLQSLLCWPLIQVEALAMVFYEESSVQCCFPWHCAGPVTEQAAADQKTISVPGEAVW